MTGDISLSDFELIFQWVVSIKYCRVIQSPQLSRISIAYKYSFSFAQFAIFTSLQPIAHPKCKYNKGK